MPAPASSPLDALDALGRHGTRAVAAVVLLGFALPAVGGALRPLIAPAVFILLSVAFMRMDLGACRAYLRRPGLVLAAIAWTSLGVPILFGFVGRLTGLGRHDPDLDLGLVLQGAASPMMATPAFAALLGLDATLVLVTLVGSTLLAPLTIPLFAQLFVGSRLPIDPAALAAKLFLLLVAAAFVGLSARRVFGVARIEWHRNRIDGLNVLVLFVFIVALTGSVGPRIVASPVQALLLLAYGTIAFFATFVLTRLCFEPAGDDRAFALAIMTAQRNLGLVLAAAGGVLPGTTWLYFALAQLPIYLSPEVFRELRKRIPVRMPALDPEKAEHLVGKRLLVGLTYVDHEEKLIEQKQIHGRVIEISASKGVVIQLPDASLFRLPPDLGGVRPAPPGVYRLRATGEEVSNPDYLCEWVLQRSAPETKG